VKQENWIYYIQYPKPTNRKLNFEQIRQVQSTEIFNGNLNKFIPKINLTKSQISEMLYATIPTRHWPQERFFFLLFFLSLFSLHQISGSIKSQSASIALYKYKMLRSQFHHVTASHFTPLFGLGGQFFNSN
jgi:hypothetical protein